MVNTVCEVMRYCANFFEHGYIDADFTVSEDGVLSPIDGIVSGQYVAVQGSTLHDGVYRIEGGRLDAGSAFVPAEVFSGRIWLLHPPADFLNVCRMVEAFENASGKVNGPFQSESFGAYSYTRASGANGGLLTWQEAFSSRLRPYVKMFTEVDV